MSTTWSAGGNEDSGEFSPVASGLPLAAGSVPEGFPLGGEVAISGWDTEEECVLGCVSWVGTGCGSRRRLKAWGECGFMVQSGMVRLTYSARVFGSMTGMSDLAGACILAKTS